MLTILKLTSDFGKVIIRVLQVRIKLKMAIAF